jgi:hypothetical protein
MTRHLKADERIKRAKARREGALARAELREPSEPRAAPQGATSFPVKVRDPGIDAAIQAFLAGKATAQ